MPNLTFQVIEGVDKGRTFREMPTPVTIGREEGNVLRLNDERVSRYHAKVQTDNGDIILTDLDSTNGTRVNGNVVQIRRLRAGDRICIGRTQLLFGSSQEIAARMAALQAQAGGKSTLGTSSGGSQSGVPNTVQAQTVASQFDQNLDFDLNITEEVTVTEEGWFQGQQELPPLPQKLTPAQAARLAEILDFLHRGLTSGTENIRASDDGTQVTLSFRDWQTVLAVQMLLGRYLRAIADPDALTE